MLICRVRTIRQRTTPSRYLLNVAKVSFMMMATVQSSRTKGKMSAPANGQPSNAPTPNHIIPTAVFDPPCQSMNAVNPKVLVYMAKLDGKKATEA